MVRAFSLAEWTVTPTPLIPGFILESAVLLQRRAFGFVVGSGNRERTQHRPHSALGIQTAADYARQWRTNNEPQLT